MFLIRRQVIFDDENTMRFNVYFSMMYSNDYYARYAANGFCSSMDATFFGKSMLFRSIIISHTYVLNILTW
jgi:hypothetical protein